MTGLASTPATHNGFDTLNRDQARTIRDFFLSSIVGEHNVTRELIKSVPPDKLDFQAVPGGATMSDLMWYLVILEHHLLVSVCDAHFAPAPATPKETGCDAVLAWDDEHFPSAYQRFAQLSGDDLLRPVELFGSTSPSVMLLPTYLNLVIQHRGQLELCLRICAAHAQSVPPIQTGRVFTIRNLSRRFSSRFNTSRR